jgi:hypothetical protein
VINNFYPNSNVELEYDGHSQYGDEYQIYLRLICGYQFVYLFVDGRPGRWVLRDRNKFIYQFAHLRDVRNYIARNATVNITVNGKGN